MEVQVVNKDTLKVVGRIDTATCGEFQQQALAALENAGDRLVLELEGLDYISSAGLRSLLVLATCAQRKQTEVVLCNVQHLVREVLEMSGFDSFFTIQD